MRVPTTGIESVLGGPTCAVVKGYWLRRLAGSIGRLNMCSTSVSTGWLAWRVLALSSAGTGGRCAR